MLGLFDYGEILIMIILFDMENAIIEHIVHLVNFLTVYKVICYTFLADQTPLLSFCHFESHLTLKYHTIVPDQYAIFGVNTGIQQQKVPISIYQPIYAYFL